MINIIQLMLCNECIYYLCGSVIISYNNSLFTDYEIIKINIHLVGIINDIANQRYITYINLRE